MFPLPIYGNNDIIYSIEREFYMILERKRLIFDISVIAIILLFLIFIGDNIMDVISPFAISLVVAYLLNPLVNFLVKKGVKRSLAILLVFLIIIGIIVGLFMTFIPRLASDIKIFADNIPSMIEGVNDFLTDVREGDLSIPFDLTRFIDVDKGLQELTNTIRNGLASFSTLLIQGTGKLITAIMVPIITFYYLKDKDVFISITYGSLPNSIKRHTKSILKDIDGVIGGFLKGQLIVATFVGILTGLGCGLIGLPYPLTIGLLAGVTNIIPYFGPFLGGITPMLVALMTNPISALWVILLILLIQQLEGNFLSPQIMSQSVGLHPLAVMFSVLLFGNVFGIIGMIIGVPIAGTIKVLIKHGKAFRERLQVD